MSARVSGALERSMVGRLIRHGAALVAVLLALAASSALGSSGGLAFAAEEPADAPAPAAPTAIAIPYRGTEQITPAAPWRIADCSGVANPLVVGCTEEAIDLAAPDYDPDAGVTRLAVPFTNGELSMTVEYQVSLAAPDAPVLRPSQAAQPVAAGSLLRVPISDLGLTCTACAEGGAIETVGVEPAEAGSAWATPTHIVFRAAAGFAGPVEVHLRVADDYGTWSAEAAVYAGVYRPASPPVVALDVFAPLDGGTATVDLGELVTSIAGDDLVLVACGGGLYGQVACGADGVATYSGSGAIDQFSFRFAAGGEQAGGSVTLVPAGAGLPEAGPVPMAPAVIGGDAGDDADTARIALAVIPPEPAEHDGSVAGVFTPFVATLDRVGAR
ncbi:hypothetical protein FLP10_12405 [Agromyces intestinalis]|uniref:Uncharacterized protein n=1 Tax=Agromyces intestinalis TaxID=2592652 RepID=A0A5C1YG50_9MICO|nr:hypothetical protein [Agromyces intestinalis]QEO15124.1 hypothetical protein FLP10_12405 [Agromyces intestinalis]